MKTKKVVLYAEQLEAVREYLDRAQKWADSGKPGMVMAQIVELRDGTGVMLVNFADHELSNKIAAAQGKEPKILESVAQYD